MISQYPKLNDAPHERPTLSVYGKTLVGELAWLLVPLLILAIALFVQ